jgi:tRNA U34 2-thiouridine synthase MnmA/TrmU
LVLVPSVSLELISVAYLCQIGGSGVKWFVSGKCMATQKVYVCPGTHHPALYSDSLEASAAEFNWIGEPPTAVSDAMQVRGQAGLHIVSDIRILRI